jgi:hypothetical protein
MIIHYVAQTRDHLLMLDEEGVCIDVHRRRIDWDGKASEGAAHCLGAQYVATLDPSEPGFLGHDPTLGVPMLFAKVGPTGKISIVRTGPLERFDVRGACESERPTEPILTDSLLSDTQRCTPAIHYLAPVSRTGRPSYGDEDEPTLRFRTPAPTRSAASPQRPAHAPPPALRSVPGGRARVA